MSSPPKVPPIEPVVKQILVDASAERCFRVFTDGIDRWWPRAHHIGQSPMKRAVIEPKVGGRWYAESQDGTECDTGRVLVWDPPRRLVLSWQITSAWQYDPAFVTEVEVRFTALGPKRTQVDFEHRHLERFGDAAAEIRKQIGAPEGWLNMLDLFGKLASSDEAGADAGAATI